MPRPEPGPPGRQHYQAQGAAIPLEPDCQERDLLPHLPNLPHLSPCLVGSALLATLGTGLYRPSEKCSLCLAGVVPDLGDQEQGLGGYLNPHPP